MKALVVLLVAVVAGCATPKESANEKKAAAPKDTVRPVYPVGGRIALVNEKARFVIIDFTNSRPPELEQKLAIYRAGLKVADVKVSGPFRNTTVAADIMAGEVRYGDEVKAE